MTFNYTQGSLKTGITYTTYRQAIDNLLALPPVDEAAEKMHHYTRKNVSLMDRYDRYYPVSDEVKRALERAYPATWLGLRCLLTRSQIVIRKSEIVN